MTTADARTAAATGSLPAAGTPTGPDGQPPAGDLPTAAGRFRVVAFHARGGLGEVLIADDDELPRRVALKRIQPHLADNPVRRARFAREAEITGRLEHPGVVPIYGRVAGPDGEPFYAMRFIAGESLRDATARVHGLPPGPERDREVRGLLGRFVAVCHAVGYAHSQGVVHRDLKPANVMLGGFGETYVVDWGLAKAVGDAEASCDAVISDVERTATGVAAGTPAYMPPEQMRGEHAVVGPASDVYALGATLHHLLTGQPPDGPGQVGAGTPPALAAVCRKATAPRPADRYPTAAELGADVERWLADAPVSARREPLGERVRRWARRHRTLVGSIAVGTAVALIAAVWVLVVVGLKNAELALKNVELAASNRLSREALDRATVAITESLTDPRALTPPQKRQLEVVLPYYQQFAAAPGLSAQVRADDQARLGLILYLLGRFAESAAASRAAADLYATLSGGDEERSRVVCLTNLGNALADLDDTAGAEAAYRDGLALRRRKAAAEPPSAFLARDLGDSLYNLAKLLRDNGRDAEALALYDEAVSTLAPFAAGDARVRTLLQHTHNGRAMLLFNMDRFADAAAGWHRAATFAASPADRAYYLSWQATALSQTADQAAAVAAAEAALAGRLGFDRVYAMAAVYAKASPLSASHAARALTLARAALAAGFDCGGALYADGEWKAMCDAPGYAELLWAAADGPPAKR